MVNLTELYVPTLLFLPVQIEHLPHPFRSVTSNAFSGTLPSQWATMTYIAYLCVFTSLAASFSIRLPYYYYFII